MRVKYWDETLQKWITTAASNASNLELSNPGYLDNLGKSVSIDHGFTKVANKLTKIEQNLAWIYLNGALGGPGGGTGGPGESSYTIGVEEGTSVYTSTKSTSLNVTISSGTQKRAFTLVAKDITNNITLGSWRLYSLTKTKIVLNNLSGTIDVELTAYDADNNYTLPRYVKVIAGAISLTMNKLSTNVIYIGGSSQLPALFNLTNNISGSPATFTLTANNIEVAKDSNITSTQRTISYNLRNILFNSGNFSPYSGQKFTFIAKAFTMLGDQRIDAETVTFEVAIADSQRLVILTSNISDSVPTSDNYDELTTVEQNGRLIFNYYLSYGQTKYNSFNVRYKVYKNTDVDTIIYSGEVYNVPPNDASKILSIHADTEVSNPGEYYIVEIYSYATSDISDTEAQDTAKVYFKIKEASTNILGANNDYETLLAYFSNLSGFPTYTTGTWTYRYPTTNHRYKYSGLGAGTSGEPTWFPDGIKLTLKDVNGVSSGFLQETARELEAKNQIPGIRLQGESYGYIELAKQMFPNTILGTGMSFIHEGGFNISFTYKAEESSDSTEVIAGIGKYEDGELSAGFEITLEKVILKVGRSQTLSCYLPQNSLLTIDIDLSTVGNGWYFKIFINGILSAVSRLTYENIDWMFGTDLFLGCRNDAGVRSRFSNVTFYDIKLYTSSQSEYAIVQNYISATEQANLIDGEVDKTLDQDLRIKNFFDSDGNCVIWDKTNGNYLEGEQLYNQLKGRLDNTYPIMLIEETSSVETNFRAYSTAIFPSDDKTGVMKYTTPVKITYTTNSGEVTLQTPEGINVSDENRVRIGLQGTSSLTYGAKNYELYCGHKNEAGDDLLFLPTDDWLPENRFTLKADVMDSAHVNNVVIGKIINGEVKRGNYNIKPLEATPPMQLGDAVWGNSEKANAIRSKIKHTSDGFPILLFIKYAPDSNQNRLVEFKGIYNFNLGRHAHYNLGLKLLKDFTKETLSGPSVVTEYEVAPEQWNKDASSGVYSVEINQNNSEQGGFQQDHESIVKFMGDIVYKSDSRSDEDAIQKVKSFYHHMANMTLNTFPKYKMDDSNTTFKVLSGLNIVAEAWNSSVVYQINQYAYNSSFQVFKSTSNGNVQPIPTQAESAGNWQYHQTINTLDLYYKNREYYNFNRTDLFLNWNNACGYFVLAMIFGMVDSLCKNLTLRNWGSDSWYTTFYDMDTAFGLNNAGQDIVDYFAHIHRWENVHNVQGNLTTYERIPNYKTTSLIRQHYAAQWGRIWEVLENLGIEDPGAIGSRATLESVYANLRLNLFPDPDAFIEQYYAGYTSHIGSIIFNYDYRIKYLKLNKEYNSVTGEYIDSTDFTQLSFLHGNRVMHVKDWFRKRIYFLDSVYDISKSSAIQTAQIKSPFLSIWAANKAHTSIGDRFVAKMASKSKILFRYSLEKNSGSFWLDSKPADVVLPTPGGEMVYSIYANNYLTKFDNLNKVNWTSLPYVDLPLLEELDLSGINSVPFSNFFSSGVYTAGVGLKNIRKLILKNVKLSGDSSTAYELNVENCEKLQELDVSFSSITSVKYPKSAVLKKLNLSGTTITKLKLENQAFLNDLKIESCNQLTELEIVNCNNLTELDIPLNVQKVKISNCNLLSGINLPYNSISNSISQLTHISIDNCPGLKSFNISGQNNPALVVELVGARNLERLDLQGTASTNLLLPPLAKGTTNEFNSLKSLDISRTKFSAFKYNDQQDLDYLDLSNFKDLDSIITNENKELVRIKVANNPDNPIDLPSRAFYNCTNLEKIEGNFRITGVETFKGCALLELNDFETYSFYGTSFIDKEDSANISFHPTLVSLQGTFENCSKISYDDFKYLKIRIGSAVTSIETMFKGCNGISGDLHYDMFVTSPNLLNIKEAFSGCKLKGRFYSRSLNYDPNNKQTWGILDFIPKVQDAEGAFENNSIDWIDNRVFAPVIIDGVKKYSSLVRVNRMFSGNASLKSCVNTAIDPMDIPEEGNLLSEDFFLNLRNLATIYPSDVFAGCTKVNMLVSNYDNNSLLFHTIKSISTPLILENNLYNGINLIGDIKVNIFGGVSQTININSETYYIPTFTSIQSPFSTISGENLTIKISEMGSIFRNISNSILQAINIFNGVKIHPDDSGKIPNDIFLGCSKLNSIEGFFSDLDITNNNEVYEFPNLELFKDCVSLKNVANLFKNCHNLKIKLIPEGFKNCSLTDVSGIFQNSGLFGVIPYRLFFMEKTTDGKRRLSPTINYMNNAFSGCWNLGYDHTRKILIGAELSSTVSTTWADHIVDPLHPGNPVKYKLDVTNLKKSYNFDRDENEFIEFTSVFWDKVKYTKSGDNYEIYDVSDRTFYQKNIDESYSPYNYNGYSLEEVYIKIGDDYFSFNRPDLFIKNPKYNPGEYAFDTWYLDGYGWTDASTSESTLNDNTDLTKVKERLTELYFKYDTKQALISSDVNSGVYYKEKVLQNYAIPTDLFRYCSSNATLGKVLYNLTWIENIRVSNDQTGGYSIITNPDKIEGLFGRIPAKLFDSLVSNRKFDAVFENTRFEPYLGLSSDLTRGVMFPPNMLRYNSELQELTTMFANISFPVGVDVNSDLLIGNTRLTNISNLFINCVFDKRSFVLGSETDNISQISWDMFKNNPLLTNASSLFAAYINEPNVTRGLYIINRTLFDSNKNMNNISNMFYNNRKMIGEVPQFESSMYTRLVTVSNYLYSVPKSNITNAGNLETRLVPAEWLT